MVPFASKALWGLGALAVVAAIAYGVATNDSSGGAILAFVATGAILLGVVVVIADPDREPFFVAGAPLSEQTAVGGRPSVPSPWPLIAAVALGALAIGAATDAVVVVIAAILLAVSGVGWLLQTWTEHPTYTGQYAARLKERLLLPVGLPVGVASLVAVIVISLSRIFLALPENGTRAVALAVALVILLSAFAVAASERMARTALDVADRVRVRQPDRGRRRRPRARRAQVREAQGDPPRPAPARHQPVGHGDHSGVLGMTGSGPSAPTSTP